MDILQLNNTVRLYHLHDTRYKTETLSLHFLIPTDEKLCAAQYMLPSVLMDGCNGYPDEYSIEKRLSELYGADISHRVSRVANYTEICVTADCLATDYTLQHEDIFSAFIQLLFSVLYDPLVENGCFSEKYLCQEKKQLCHEIKERQHRRDVYARILTRRALVEEEIYRHPIEGNLHDISRVDTDVLMQAYTALLSSHLYMIYSGARTIDEVASIIPVEVLCGHHTGSFSTLKYASHTLSEQTVYLSRTYPISQTHITEGYVTDVTPEDTLWDAYPVFLQLLSESPTAILFRDVRETMSSCYSCQAYLDSACGLMMLQASVEPGREREVARAMRASLMRVQTGDFTDDMLDEARKAAVSGFVMTIDRRDTLSMWLSRRIALGKSLEYEAHLARLSEISREDVIALSQHFVRRAHVRVAGEVCDNDN